MKVILTHEGQEVGVVLEDTMMHQIEGRVDHLGEGLTEQVEVDPKKDLVEDLEVMIDVTERKEQDHLQEMFPVVLRRFVLRNEEEVEVPLQVHDLLQVTMIVRRSTNQRRRKTAARNTRRVRRIITGIIMMRRVREEIQVRMILMKSRIEGERGRDESGVTLSSNS